MEQRRLSESLDRLAPADRAVLELSKRRGMTDDEIAEVMGTTVGAVMRRRRHAVDLVAVRMGAADSDDRKVVDRDLDRLLSADGARPEAARALPETASDRPASTRTRARATTVDRAARPGTPGVEVARVRTASSSAAPATEQRPQPGWPVVVAVAIALALIGAAIGYGLSALSQQGAAPPDGSRPVASFSDVPTTVSAPLPGDASRYRCVDVSAEPRDGNESHSGRSPLRVPTDRLFS